MESSESSAPSPCWPRGSPAWFCLLSVPALLVCGLPGFTLLLQNQPKNSAERKCWGSPAD